MGNITGESSVGGIAGTNFTSPDNVLNSYNTGTISGDSEIGGIVRKKWFNKQYSVLWG